jgi:hypothetical protein
MRTCWGITREVKCCSNPTGDKFLCVRHRRQPIYFIVVAVTGVLFSYCSGLLPKPSLPWEKEMSQEPPAPKTIAATAASTAGPPPSPLMTENSHTRDNVRVVVRRHDLREKAGREKIRKQLTKFIAQGEELRSRLVAPQLSDADADAAIGRWDSAVRRFLDEHMGTDYVTRFGSSEGVTYATPLATPNSKVKKELWRSIYARDFRLRQFLQEVKD